MPGDTSSFLFLVASDRSVRSDAATTSVLLLLVVRPGATPSRVEHALGKKKHVHVH